VLDSGRGEDGVAGPQGDDVTAALLDQCGALDDVQVLADGVRVPCRTGARGEVTEPIRTRDGSSPASTMVGWTSPVNQSAGPFEVCGGSVFLDGFLRDQVTGARCRAAQGRTMTLSAARSSIAA